MRRTLRIGIACAGVAALMAAVAPGLSAYCLTGVRWPADADVYYNPAGKVTTGQCISATQMDGAVTGGVSAWRALRNAGTTTRLPNKKDGVNVVGWANLGGQTLGVTNYLKYDRTRTVSCGGQLFANLYESDVRLSTAWRWISGGGSCPCAAGSATYLDTVSEHEFGHVIGLCHTNNPASLMYPSVGTCEHKSAGGDENSGENALCY